MQTEALSVIGDHFAQLHVEDMLMDYLILHIVLNIIAMVAARSGHVALIGIDVALCAIQEIAVPANLQIKGIPATAMATAMAMTLRHPHPHLVYQAGVLVRYLAEAARKAMGVEIPRPVIPSVVHLPFLISTLPNLCILWIKTPPTQ